MKRKTQKRKRKSRLMIILFVLAIAVIATVFVLYNVDFKHEDAPAEQPVATTQIEPEKPEQPETEQKEEPVQAVEEEKQPQQYEGNNPNQANGITGTITYAQVVDQKAVIRVNIDQYVTGQCVIKITSPSGKQYSERAKLIPQTSTSTCDGFDIATARLQPGNNKIVINIESKNKTGSIEGEITL